MSKIYFKTGVMTSGKTLDLIRVVYNYREKGHTVWVAKPVLDTRDGGKISTRAGLSIDCKWFDVDTLAEDLIYEQPSAVIIDEAQFLSPEEVDKLQNLCYNYNVPIILYGLKTTFQGELFPGSKRIIEIADKVEEFKCMCSCGRPAKQSARVVNGQIIKHGETVAIGGNELYTAVCNHCFHRGEMKK